MCYCDKSALALRVERADNGTKFGQTISLECAAGKCSLNNPGIAKHTGCSVGLAAGDLRLGDFGLETPG